jgi:hypothetical protein
MHRSLAVSLVGVLVWVGPAAADGGGPYQDGKFKGRIAYSADGNHNDPDDWAASLVALAIFAEAGLNDRLVHFHYNCILPETNAEWEKFTPTAGRSLASSGDRSGLAVAVD